MAPYRKYSRQRNPYIPRVSASGQRRSLQTALSEQQKEELFQIMRTALNRTSQDIETWRAAIRQAENPENPNRRRLIELYADLVLDDHMKSQLRIRKAAVRQTGFLLIDRNGEPNDEAKYLFYRPWFKQFLNHALDANFFGHSVIEFYFRPTQTYYPLNLPVEASHVKLVDRRYVSPEFGLVFQNIGDTEGWVIADNPEAIEVGERNNLGDLVACAPAWIYKKNAVSCWSEFSEKFGNPILVARTSNRNTDVLDRLEDTLKNMGSMAYGLLDDNEQVELIESSKSDAFKVYDELAKRSEKAMSKVITGATMLSDDGSSYAQSKVHEQVAGYIFEDDRDNMAWLINDKLIPLLVMKGYPLDGLTFEWNLEQEESLDGRIKLYDFALKHYHVPAEHIQDTFGIPVEDKQPNSGGGTPPAPAPPAPDDPITYPNTDPDADPADDPATQAKLSWWQNLIGSLKKKSLSKVGPSSRQSSETVANGMPCCGDWAHTDIRAIDEGILNAIWAGMLAEVFSLDNPSAYFNMALFDALADQLMEGFQRKWNRRDSDPPWDAADHVAKAYYRANIFAFSAAKSMAQIQEVTAELTDGKGNTRSFEQFQDAVKIKGIFDKYNRNWLRAEYNHAVAAGQAASQWLEIEGNARTLAETGDVLYLRYATAGDQRVREEHMAMNGITLPWDDKFWQQYNPPNGWGCRCTVNEVLLPEAVSDSSESLKTARKAKTPKYFKRNFGDSKVAFPEDQSYFKQGFKPYSMKAVDQYGIRTPEQIRSRADSLAKATRGFSSRDEYEQWWDERVAQNTGGPPDGFVINDPIGRPLFLGEELRKSPFDRKRRIESERYQWFNRLPDVITEPDEIWTTESKPGSGAEGGLNDYVIKYYDDGAIVLKLRYDEAGTIPYSMFKAQFDNKFESSMGNTRKGVLQYKKPRG